GSGVSTTGGGWVTSILARHGPAIAASSTAKTKIRISPSPTNPLKRALLAATPAISPLRPHRQFVAAGIAEVEAAAPREVEDRFGDRSARGLHLGGHGLQVVGVEDHQ